MTKHEIIIGNSNNLKAIPDGSVNLIVTSPPYPTVLDPFNGLGTTILACMASQRNSIGVEIDPDIADLAISNIERAYGNLNTIISERIDRHLSFIDSLPDDKKQKCYTNDPHGFLVKTRQETSIKLDLIKETVFDGRTITCEYE